MTKKTQVAVKGQFNEDSIPAMLEQVNDALKKLTGDNGNGSVITDGDLEEFGKIKDINTLEDIVKALSMVEAKAKAYAETAARSSFKALKIPEFKIDGMTESQMVAHLELRANEVGKKDQIETLTKLKEELEFNLSEEQKRANSAKKIEGMLGDLGIQL